MVLMLITIPAELIRAQTRQVRLLMIARPNFCCLIRTTPTRWRRYVRRVLLSRCRRARAHIQDLMHQLISVALVPTLRVRPLRRQWMAEMLFQVQMPMTALIFGRRQLLLQSLKLALTLRSIGLLRQRRVTKPTITMVLPALSVITITDFLSSTI